MDHVVALLVLVSDGDLVTELVVAHAERRLAVDLGDLVALLEAGGGRRRCRVHALHVVGATLRQLVLVELEAEQVRDVLGNERLDHARRRLMMLLLLLLLLVMSHVNWWLLLVVGAELACAARRRRLAAAGYVTLLLLLLLLLIVQHCYFIGTETERGRDDQFERVNNRQVG